jgi:hypothetical protein
MHRFSGCRENISERESSPNAELLQTNIGGSLSSPRGVAFPDRARKQSPFTGEIFDSELVAACRAHGS